MGCDFSAFTDNRGSAPSGIKVPAPVEVVQHKLILVGDISVGKSSLVQRLLGKGFKEEHISTIGTAFASVTLQPRDDMDPVTLQVWDTAGEERYRSMSKFFFRQTQVGILVFDVQVPETLKKLKSWYDDIVTISPSASFIVVANKIDCGQDLRQVSTDEGRHFAQEISAEYAETSAKTEEGVIDMFRSAALLSLKNVQSAGEASS